MSAGRAGPSFMVVGSARSGTTLVQRLACEVPGVAMPPETHFFDMFAADLLRRGRPPFGAERIAEEVAAWAAMPQVRGVHIDPRAVVTTLDGHCGDIGDLFDGIVQTLVGHPSCYGEKTPNHLYWWRPLSVVFPSLKFVAVVRDPRAVVVSNLAAPWLPDLLHPSWAEDAYVALAERSRLELEIVDELATALPDRVLVLRYEDAVTDPAAARRAIAETVRPAASRATSVPAAYVLPWETWKPAATAPIDDARATAWRDELEPRRAEVVSAICQGTMERFGYQALDRGGRPGRGSLLRLALATQRRRLAYRRNLRRYARSIATETL